MNLSKIIFIIREYLKFIEKKEKIVEKMINIPLHHFPYVYNQLLTITE